MPEKAKLLLKKFIGKGEVSGKTFKRIKTSKYVYMYIVDEKEEGAYYETFIRRVHKLYNTETYPSSKQFGNIALTSLDEETALKQFKQLHLREKKRLGKKSSTKKQ